MPKSKDIARTVIGIIEDHGMFIIVVLLAVLFLINGCSCHITINSTPTTQEAQ